MTREAFFAVSTASVVPQSLRTRVRLPVIRAEGGDHPAIFCFLQAAARRRRAPSSTRRWPIPSTSLIVWLLLRRERQSWPTCIRRIA